MNSDYSRPSGGGPSPAVIVFGALVLSALVFFFFTKKHLTPKAPAPEVATSPAAPVATAPQAAATTPSPSTTPEPKPTQPAPKPSAPMALGFARPMDLGTQVARSLASGDIAQVAKMAGGGDPAQEAAVTAVLEKILKSMGYKPGTDDKVQLLGQVGEATRLSVPLLKPGETTPLALQLDVERDLKMGWKITKFHLPKELETAVASAPATSIPGTTPNGLPVPPAPAGSATMSSKTSSTSLFVVEQNPDALTFASRFVDAMLREDVAEARKYVDETKVTSQKLAGMCIVFEEGVYALKASKPMVITVASPNESWVIVQVQSEKLQQATEFGLEMQRSAEDQPWRIVGLNLSDLLGSFAKNASKMGVPYTPMVVNPKGGESLALYFEYDKATLHPRAQKQLAIVADLLKAKASRKLRITGRTDSLGTDGYNLQLSAARAKNVKEQLAALGVPADQVITEGMGKADPTGRTEKKADGTDDPEGRSRNRRAEIFLDF